MTKIDTAWRDETVLPQDMLMGAMGLKQGWKQLEDTDHCYSLKECLDQIPENSKIIDIGCGSGDLGRVFNKYIYTGCDLPHIIEKVAKKKNPNLVYRYFDAENDSYTFLQEYDCIIMNSFLSEIPFYDKCLMKVLLNSRKYVLIHRQEFTNKESHLIEYETYAGLSTVKSIINRENFIKISKNNGFYCKKELLSEISNESLKTILLYKTDDA